MVLNFVDMVLNFFDIVPFFFDNTVHEWNGENGENRKGNEWEWRKWYEHR